MRQIDLTEKDVARFWRKVSRLDISRCWPWLGGINKGYGNLWVMTGEGLTKRTSLAAPGRP